MVNVFDNASEGSDSDSSAIRRQRSEKAKALLEESRLSESASETPSASAQGGGIASASAQHKASDKERAHTAFTNAKNSDDVGGEDDEDELRRMRASKAYSEYANEYQRDAAHKYQQTREQTAHRGTDLHDEGREEADTSDDDAEIGPLIPPHVPAVSLEESQIKLVMNKTQNNAERDVSPKFPARRPRRPVDPKIIDDSSDDDSSDSKQSGDDSDIAPEGPVFPDAESSRTISQLPLSHDATFGSRHDAQVTSISVDAAGSRFVTASADASLRLWDFGTMDTRLQSFKAVDPLESGPVFSAQFSKSGGRILCAGNISVARVLDRDGSPMVETVPGDMYLVDMAQTKGHVAPLAAAVWLTNDAARFATVAADSTLRLWDTTAATAPTSVFDGDISRAKQLKVIKLRNSRGTRTNATALCCLSRGNEQSRVIVGCDDGSVKVIDPQAFALRPAVEIPQAVNRGAEVTALDLSEGGSNSALLLLVRSTDDALRLFDLRKHDAPIAQFFDLPNSVPQTNAAFAGDENEWFITGTSANRRSASDHGRIVVYSSKTLRCVYDCAVSRQKGSVIALKWHSRINQVLFGCSDGSVHAMYNPSTSSSGILRCLHKSERRKQTSVVAVGVRDLNVVSGSSWHLRSSSNRKERSSANNSGAAPSRSDARRFDPRPPDVPDPAKITGTFTKAFMKAKVKTRWADEDPREALLKYDEEARRNPKFTAAYSETQPKPLLADKTLEQEHEELRADLHEPTKRRRTASNDTGENKARRE